MPNTDVTDQMGFSLNDDEILPLTKCICGATWKVWSGPYISIYEDDPYSCPKCGRKFFWSSNIRVFQVE